MRGLEVDGAAHFTAINCLSIAYGPGHERRRRQWMQLHANSRGAKKTTSWSATSGFEFTVEFEIPAGLLEELARVR